MEPIRIAVKDRDTLQAHHYPANAPARRNRSIIVGPATAAPQTVYIKFCQYLAEHGYDVLCFDYRGIGQSFSGDIRDYHDIGFSAWAEYDYPAVIEHMHARYPGQPLYIVGHSVGGWMPGTTRASHRIDGILGVAALSAHWPLRARPQRYWHWFAWHAVVPTTTALLGYWPGWAGLKMDLSASLGREFAAWAKSPGFVFDATQFDARGNAAKFTGQLHLLQIEDDPWGTPAAVSALQPFYPKARRNVMETVRPADYGLQKIGHLAFFRSQYRETLWPMALARLNDFG